VTDEELVTLLVVESGAEWPAWSSHATRLAQTNLIETEVAEETDAEFEARVLGRLSRLREQNKRLACAGYVAAAGPHPRGVRESVCAAMLELMVPHGELIVAGSHSTSSGSAHSAERDLLELWQGLSERGAPQLISLRFSPDPVSGPTPLANDRNAGAPALGGWQ
jgi:hypothetical protein